MFVVTIDQEKCEGCGECAESCPADILTFENGKAFVSGDAADCMGCETCVSVCPSGAATIEEK